MARIGGAGGAVGTGEPRLFGKIGPDESQAGNLVPEPSTYFSVILVLLDVLCRNISNTGLLSTQINSNRLTF